MGRLREGLLELLFPRRCVFCGARWASDLPCPDCQRDLPWLTEGAAERDVEFVDKCASALRYQDKVRTCVHGLKFRRRAGYLRTLGPLVAQCVRDHFAPGEIDLVTWVPLSPKGFRRRGFDQSQRLAGYAAETLGLEPVSLFAKDNRAGQQSLLREAAARRANVLGAFKLTRPQLAEGRRVLVVDDIVTSGATLSECARLLRMAGCAGVSAVTLVRAWNEK